MTAAAEQVLRELKSLPPDDLLAVWEQAKGLVDRVPVEPAPAEATAAPTDALDAIRSLYGCLKGRGLSAALLRERTRERARERAQDEARIKDRSCA
jgi:hypothetical protein